MSSDAIDRLVERWKPGRRSVHDALSPPLRLLTDLVGRLRREPKSCFLAAPFRNPYEGYYASYYRPLIESLGYRCVRAWGGFGQEDFSPLLVATMFKCGLVFADVSGGNPNVMWELGVAHGARKSTLLVHDGHGVPADLREHPTLSYRPTAKGWGKRAIRRQKLPMLLLLATLDRLRHDPARFAAGLRPQHTHALMNDLMAVVDSAMA
jgi:hypothetical protein